MTAKTYMENIAHAEKELKILGARRRHYVELATSLGVNLDSTPVVTSGGSSRVETAAVSICDLVTELDVNIAAYVQQIKEAEENIAKIPQEKFRELLTYKYLCGMSWRSISDQMDYKDAKSVFRVHGYALKELQKVLTTTC